MNKRMMHSGTYNNRPTASHLHVPVLDLDLDLTPVCGPLCFIWASSRYSGSLPQTTDTLVRLFTGWLEICLWV